ncbi:DUF2061 domain-containing protein [Novosphingobium sp. KACC 22771]|uniref:DUF2061 domain-containing protein n=1 Tax=Novosphingobium sp. KACC 22771 TaxID=3025670 RepID=UPI00236643E0|nr:DUF2061 domain-containing protein [Novosphingobium sp. KACC 22771]WDF72604.1 DUF2061 domain-containing protein [Novosphingobium sp. KACC 22771]
MLLFNGHESHSRSLIKGISWRVLGSIDTFILSWLFSGHAKTAAAIASTEVITKVALYYFHERVWSSIHWGAQRAAPNDPAAEI